MSRSPGNRRRLYIDRVVQRAVLTRVTAYWTAGAVFIGGGTLLWRWVAGPAATWSELLAETAVRYAPAFLAALLFLPVVMYDALRTSHRIAGPIFRLRTTMTRLINGESPAPVQFRQDDYWHELAADFNRVRAMIPDQDPATWEAEGDAGDVDRFDDVILRR